MATSSKPTAWIDVPRQSIKSIVIVGGGTAGWLTAGLLGAKKDQAGAARFKVTLIEPPGIAPIGVGEGTWPSMRLTLSQIGVSERDFLMLTGASFKQGTKFKNWRHNKGEYYYHPFDKPIVEGTLQPVEAWRASRSELPFARYVGVQEDLCEAQKSPKLHTSRDFAGVMNYGYHFESDGMAAFLKSHCEKNLGVKLVPDVMVDVKAAADGHITAVETRDHGSFEGDVFVDCTGFRGLLIKRHFKARTISLNSVFSCDRAVVARVPYKDTVKIESTTLSTAQEAGWIWDVSLAKRFGVGYVFSSTHTNSSRAQETLSEYVLEKGFRPSDISFRELKFEAGYVEKCWHKNCVAIGLSSGFVEPLEASSIMLTETAARELTDHVSSSDFEMKAVSKVFNNRFVERWEQVSHFLKLHYLLSERKEVFWKDHRHQDTVPETLLHDVEKWKAKGSVGSMYNGKTASESLFPLDSYGFIFHGMENRELDKMRNSNDVIATKNQNNIKRYLELLPSNRDWLSQL